MIIKQRIRQERSGWRRMIKKNLHMTPTLNQLVLETLQNKRHAPTSKNNLKNQRQLNQRVKGGEIKKKITHLSFFLSPLCKIFFFFFVCLYQEAPVPNKPVQYPVEFPCSLFISLPPAAVGVVVVSLWTSVLVLLETGFKSSKGNNSLPLFVVSSCCKFPYPWLGIPSKVKFRVGLKSCKGNPDE